MIQSVILMYSQYDKNYKISNIFKIIWMTYRLININFNLKFWFIDTAVFLFMTILIKKISKNRIKTNVFLSIVSILIYSIFIDIACYFMMPIFSNGVDLFRYILNGLVFNYKSIFLNLIIFCIINITIKIFNKNKSKSGTKQLI